MILRELSIVIPVYNEIESVGNLIQELTSTLTSAHFDFEILFVNDGSNDGTLEYLSELSKTNSRLRIISYKKNQGQSKALISGIQAAKLATIVTLDGDGQNDPADIPRLFDLMKDSTTIILGNRVCRHDSWVRKLQSKIANQVRSFFLQDNCLDTGCSLKIFPRDAFLALPYFNHMHRFLPALFQHAGYRLINVPVNHRARAHGVSKYNLKNRLWSGVFDLIGVYWLLKRTVKLDLIDERGIE